MIRPVMTLLFVCGTLALTAGAPARAQETTAAAARNLDWTATPYS